MRITKKISYYMPAAGEKCSQYGTGFLNFIIFAISIFLISCGDGGHGKDSFVKAGDLTQGSMVCKTTKTNQVITYSTGCKNPKTGVVLRWTPSNKTKCDEINTNKKPTRCFS